MFSSKRPLICQLIPVVSISHYSELFMLINIIHLRNYVCLQMITNDRLFKHIKQRAQFSSQMSSFNEQVCQSTIIFHEKVCMTRKERPLSQTHMTKSFSQTSTPRDSQLYKHAQEMVHNYTQIFKVDLISMTKYQDSHQISHHLQLQVNSSQNVQVTDFKLSHPKQSALDQNCYFPPTR